MTTKLLIALGIALAVIALLTSLCRRRRVSTNEDLLAAIETSRLGADARAQLRELIEDRRLRPSQYVERNA